MTTSHGGSLAALLARRVFVFRRAALSTTATGGEDDDYHHVRGEFMAHGRIFNRSTSPKDLEAAINFRYKPTDVIINTYPRTGTIITQEIVWRLTYGKRSPEQARDHMELRCPVLEMNSEYSSQEGLPNSIERLNAWPEERGPRLIKTHIPLELIRDNIEAAAPRLIINFRNPKDTAVGLYHLYRGISYYGPWAGDWNELFQIFLAGKTMTGSYFDNVKDWWSMRDRPNVLILRFEDLVRQPHQEVRRIAAHLDLPRPSVEEEQAIVSAIQFHTMKNNPSVTRWDDGTGFNLIRSGKVGGWRAYFSVEQNAVMDAEVRKRFGSGGPSFQYE